MKSKESRVSCTSTVINKKVPVTAKEKDNKSGKMSIGDLEHHGTFWGDFSTKEADNNGELLSPLE